MMISVLKRALPFVLTLMMGIGLGSIFGFGGSWKNNASVSKPSSWRWHSRCNRDLSSRISATKVVIKFIPYAPHTDEAYSHQVYGTVKLRVEFKDDGTIGEIETVEGMPYGLTEEAREAAKGILFTPATIDGTPVTSRKVVEFDFMAHRAN